MLFHYDLFERPSAYLSIIAVALTLCFKLPGVGMTVNEGNASIVCFSWFSDLLCMQSIAEAATLSPARYLCGRPVRWWMTAEPKVLFQVSRSTVNVNTKLSFLHFICHVDHWSTYIRPWMKKRFFVCKSPKNIVRLDRTVFVISYEWKVAQSYTRHARVPGCFCQKDFSVSVSPLSLTSSQK